LFFSFSKEQQELPSARASVRRAHRTNMDVSRYEEGPSTFGPIETTAFGGTFHSVGTVWPLISSEWFLFSLPSPSEMLGKIFGACMLV
jgi:hypothetical protein